MTPTPKIISEVMRSIASRKRGKRTPQAREQSRQAGILGAKSRWKKKKKI